MLKQTMTATAALMLALGLAAAPAAAEGMNDEAAGIETNANPSAEKGFAADGGPIEDGHAEDQSLISDEAQSEMGDSGLYDDETEVEVEE